jgi:methionyl-tRNA synthetase
VPRFFLTTAIDYANGAPHLGHALEKIGADAIARAHRQLGYDVHFLIGMDEHGQKVAQTAEKQGVAPQQFVDAVAAEFQATWARLGISNDQFMRTTAPAHKAGVAKLIEQIFTADASRPEAERNFYERSYTGMYCVGCESFKQPADITDGQCALHPTRALEEVTERNWFFRLSAYTDRLKALFAATPEYLEPESRRNEILALLDQGLDDISASRARFDWGVPFPRPLSDGETQTTYVWFDALPNYWTARFFPGFEQQAAWPAQLHVIGKDITRFHCVIWPAMLMAAGEPLPAQVWAHGFISLGGERFSKSAGVKLELSEAIDRYGVDAFRYYLLS